MLTDRPLSADRPAPEHAAPAISANHAAPGATWLLVIGVYLAYFDRFVPSAGATFLKRELGLSDAGFGLVTGSLFAIAYAAGAILFGHLARGRSLAPFLIAGVAMWTGGIIGIGYATHAEHFAAAQIVAGFGQAAFIPAAVSAISSAGHPVRIGRLTSRFSMASSLGRSSAALTAGAIIAAIGAFAIAAPIGLPHAWRATFLLTALPNSLLLVALLVMLARQQQRAVIQPVARLHIMNRAQGALVVAACAAVVMIQSTAIWFPTLLARLHGIEPARAAIMVGIVTLVSAPVGQLVGGRLLDRLAPRGVAPTTIVILGIATGGLALLLLTALPNPMAALILLGSASLALGIASVSALAGLQRATPVADRPRINGYFFATITLVGLGIGPAMTGVLSDAGTDPATALPRALAMVAATMFVLAIGAHLFARTAGNRQ